MPSEINGAIKDLRLYGRISYAHDSEADEIVDLTSTARIASNATVITEPLPITSEIEQAMKQIGYYYGSSSSSIY